MPLPWSADAVSYNGNFDSAAPPYPIWQGQSTDSVAAVELNHHRSGAGEPLVLLHGIGHHWEGWLPVIEHLDEREVIAVDLPGFGRSPMPPAGTPPGIDSLTRLVAEFLDQQRLERPHVAGNSLGGWVALELAKQGRASSVTAISPAGFHNRLEGVFERASLRLARRGSELIEGSAQRLLARPRLRRLALGQMFVHPERVHAEANVEAFARAPWFLETLRAGNGTAFSGGERIEVPVTIAWGEHDRLLLPHQIKRAAKTIPSARLIRLQGCGHVPMSDDPRQVARVLLETSAPRG